MSRSGYNDDEIGDVWQWIMYRGAVSSALRGKRGQAFLRELLAALDALPEKRLIRYSFHGSGSVCALGAVGAARGMDLHTLDVEDPGRTAQAFGIAESMAREIMYRNDVREGTPEARWESVRNWVVKKIEGGAE